MTDREAMRALAAREPEIDGRWYGVEGDPDPRFESSAEDVARWQVWHDRRNAAYAHARA